MTAAVGLPTLRLLQARSATGRSPDSRRARGGPRPCICLVRAGPQRSSACTGSGARRARPPGRQLDEAERPSTSAPSCPASACTAASDTAGGEHVDQQHAAAGDEGIAVRFERIRAVFERVIGTGGGARQLADLRTGTKPAPSASASDAPNRVKPRASGQTDTADSSRRRAHGGGEAVDRGAKRTGIGEQRRHVANTMPGCR